MNEFFFTPLFYNQKQKTELNLFDGSHCGVIIKGDCTSTKQQTPSQTVKGINQLEICTFYCCYFIV